MGLLLPLISNAQVNRYYEPAEIEYQSTYVSPDYGVLLDLAIEIRKKKEKEFIKEWLRYYQTCKHYPENISDGWHKVYIIHFENETILDVEMRVSSNKVIAIRSKKEVIHTDNIPINNGCCRIPTSAEYFYNEIKRINKNYE